MRVPQKLVVWATSFRLGDSPVWAVHCMRCTAWTGEWPNLKEVAQTTNFCGSTQSEYYCKLILKNTIYGIVSLNLSNFLNTFCFE